MLLSQLYYLLYFPQKMHLLMAVSEFPVQTLLLRRILLLPRLMLLILQPE